MQVIIRDNGGRLSSIMMLVLRIWFYIKDTIYPFIIDHFHFSRHMST